jgi:DNA modification methylase
MMEHILIHGNTFELIKTIPSESIDHIITDPPYNISGNEKQTMVGPNIVNAQFGSWDCKSKEEYDETFKYLLKEMFRVCKKNANALIWLDKAYCGVAWFHSIEIGWNPRNIIAAIKRNPAKRMRSNNLKSGYESCLWLSKGPVKTLHYNKSEQLDRNYFFYNIGVDKVTKHPTEKYESMIEPLVTMYTNEGDVVFDPFAGSGTTAVVCKKKNRSCTAIEADQKWIEVAQQRLDITTKPLF